MCTRRCCLCSTLGVLTLAVLIAFGVLQWLRGEDALLRTLLMCRSTPQPMGGRWALVLYDDRPPTNASRAAIARNRAYAARHGYELHFFNATNTPAAVRAELPPYWVKVQLVINVFTAARAASQPLAGAMWLDTDAFVRDLSVPVDAFLRSTHARGGVSSFFGAPDPPLGGMSPFCAGAWIVRNTPTGRAIMDTWRAAFPPDAWEHTPEGKWVSQGVWSGVTYEQGAFWSNLLHTYTCDITVLPWVALHGQDPLEARAFTLHYAGGAKLVLAEKIKLLPDYTEPPPDERALLQAVRVLEETVDSLRSPQPVHAEGARSCTLGL